MTNNQIITETVKAAFSPEEIAAIISASFTPEQIEKCRAALMEPAEIAASTFHTFQEWKRLGYSVKKGEHAALVAFLWKFTDKPNKAAREAAAEAGQDPEELAGGDRFYKAKSYLFNIRQVEKASK